MKFCLPLKEEEYFMAHRVGVVVLVWLKWEGLLNVWEHHSWCNVGAGVVKQSWESCVLAFSVVFVLPCLLWSGCLLIVWMRYFAALSLPFRNLSDHYCCNMYNFALSCHPYIMNLGQATALNVFFVYF